MIRNRKDLELRLKELVSEQDEKKKMFFDTSDKTRDVAGSVQKGMYFGQLALGVFRNLTNFHIPPRKRIKRVLITLSTVILINAIRQFIINRSAKKA